MLEQEVKLLEKRRLYARVPIDLKPFVVDANEGVRLLASTWKGVDISGWQPERKKVGVWLDEEQNKRLRLLKEHTSLSIETLISMALIRSTHSRLVAHRYDLPDYICEFPLIDLVITNRRTLNGNDI